MLKYTVIKLKQNSVEKSTLHYVHTYELIGVVTSFFSGFSKALFEIYFA